MAAAKWLLPLPQVPKNIRPIPSAGGKLAANSRAALSAFSVPGRGLKLSKVHSWNRWPSAQVGNRLSMRLLRSRSFSSLYHCSFFSTWHRQRGTMRLVWLPRVMLRIVMSLPHSGHVTVSPVASHLETREAPGIIALWFWLKSERIIFFSGTSSPTITTSLAYSLA